MRRSRVLLLPILSRTEGEWAQDDSQKWVPRRNLTTSGLAVRCAVGIVAVCGRDAGSADTARMSHSPVDAGGRELPEIGLVVHTVPDKLPCRAERGSGDAPGDHRWQ